MRCRRKEWRVGELRSKGELRCISLKPIQLAAERKGTLVSFAGKVSCVGSCGSFAGLRISSCELV